MKRGEVLSVTFTPHANGKKCSTGTSRYDYTDKRGRIRCKYSVISGRIPKDSRAFMATHKLEVCHWEDGSVYYRFE